MVSHWTAGEGGTSDGPTVDSGEGVNSDGTTLDSGAGY